MDLSIIIPTFNERNNVAFIVKKITSLLQGTNCSFEIIFVDDSLDDTPLILNDLCQQYQQVKYLHRNQERGLASAVVKGFLHSRGEQIIVMDADLQHPPELLPLMIKRLESYDIVIPSRFVPGGSDGGLTLFRKLISAVAREIGHLFIKKLRRISDSTSGYFGFHRKILEQVHLNPVGWKILMEILVKGNYQSVHEIPYSFIARESGKSKMNFTEQWNFIRHIGRLMLYTPEPRKFYSFCLIGTMGVLVNLFCLHFFLDFLTIDELPASINASSIAMVHNFIWNHQITWKEYKQHSRWKRWMQFPQFALICSFGIAVTTLFTQAFLYLGWSVYAGQLTGIGASTFWNFSANSKWTWADEGIEKNKREAFIVTQEIPEPDQLRQIKM